MIPRLRELISAPQVAYGPLGDVFGQIGAAFQLRDDEEEGHHVAELGALHRAGVQLLPYQHLDFGRQIVDILIPVDDRLAERRVVPQQGLGGSGEGLGDQGK